MNTVKDECEHCDCYCMEHDRPAIQCYIPIADVEKLKHSHYGTKGFHNCAYCSAIRQVLGIHEVKKK